MVSHEIKNLGNGRGKSRYKRLIILEIGRFLEKGWKNKIK